MVLPSPLLKSSLQLNNHQNHVVEFQGDLNQQFLQTKETYF